MNKRVYELMMMMAMAGVFINDTPSSAIPNDVDIERLKEQIKEAKRRRLLRGGCQEFDFGDVTIVALNKKNAERKYNNYKKLLL